METNISGNMPVIDHDVLTDVVRSVLSTENFEIENWHINQIGYGSINPVSVGVYRVQGIASDKHSKKS